MRAYGRPVQPLRRLATHDVTIAAALLVLAQGESWLSPETAGRRPEVALCTAAMAIALAWRRSRPLASLAGAMAGFAALALTGELPTMAFLLPAGVLSLYSCGAHARSERAVIGLGVALAAVGLGAARTPDPTVTDLTAPATIFTGAWFVGRSQLVRRLRLGRAEARAEAAAAEERRRIARELHDIVAHRVSTIVVQAEAGRAAAGEPGHAEAAFEAIAGSGRLALGELRSLLGVLRDGDEAALTAPQPGLGRLEALFEETRGAGVPVSARVDGELGGLPAEVDLAAYRVVQEALTNVLRHAGTAAQVDVRRDGGAVAVEVRSPLPDAPRESAGGAGQGLAGMRERVRVSHGEFSAGPAGDEFVVRATLPLEGAA
jgi:signal transduction histidine kinase